MDTGSNKSLFTLIAVVIFGIFLSLSYWMFQDELKNVLATVMDNTSETVSIKIDNKGIIPTDEKFFTTSDNADGTLTITDFSGLTNAEKDIIIPATINGKLVTAIGDYAFNHVNYNDSRNRIDVTLTSVIFPDDIKIIGYKAFNTNNISYVKLPRNLEVIGKEAFQFNSLTTVDIPYGVKTIDFQAFEGNKLKTLTIPSTVTTLNLRAFESNLITKVLAPTELKSQIIGNLIFYGQTPTITYN